MSYNNCLTYSGLLFFLFVLIAPVNGLSAQCDPNNEVESWYAWARDLENQAVDYFEFSVAEENHIGDSLHLLMKGQNKITNVHKDKKKLENMLKSIAQYAERPGINYQVHIIQDGMTLNAFSIAGGHVYVTTRLLEYVESDDELAFIIGHEIAHVDKKHALRKAAKGVVGKNYGGEYGVLAANIENFVTQPFGQIDEYEADRHGAKLAVRAGYDPRRAFDFFERMGEGEQFDLVQKVLRTHPYSHERHNCLDTYMRETLGK